MPEQADGAGFIEKRVADFFRLALLIGDENGAPRRIGEGDGSGGVGEEIARPHLGAIDEAQHQPVGEPGPEFLDQIEREAGASRPFPMQEAHLRVESGPLPAPRAHRG